MLCDEIFLTLFSLHREMLYVTYFTEGTLYLGDIKINDLQDWD